MKFQGAEFITLLIVVYLHEVFLFNILSLVSFASWRLCGNIFNTVPSNTPA